VTVLWLIFGAIVLVLLALDLGVFHREDHVVTTREALAWTGVWITVGVSFSIAVYFIYENNWFGAAVPEDPAQVVTGGGQAVLMYLTGYVLEKSLSIDNIFVIAMVFDAFGVEQRYQHRVLYWGILGAIFMRAGMVIGGAWLLTRFTWLFYPFGAYLVFTGVRMLFHKKDDKAPHDRRLVTWVRHWIPVAEGDHEGHFFVRRDGRRMVSILFLVLVVVELTDVVFAVDSVPAILAITTDPFLVLTSNIFAILGLRSLYFVLANMMARFRYLSYSLALILVLIGGKMALHHVWKVPTLLSLGGILMLLALGIGLSLARTRQPRAT
jgi:tellurite resistance protein TerC